MSSKFPDIWLARLEAITPPGDGSYFTQRLASRYNDVAKIFSGAITDTSIKALLGACEMAQDALHLFKEEVEDRQLKREEMPSNDAADDQEIVRNPFEAAEDLAGVLYTVGSWFWEKGLVSEPRYGEEVRDRTRKTFPANSRKRWSEY